MNNNNNNNNNNHNNKNNNEQLINNAAKHLGADPKQLQNAIDSGNLKKMLGNLSPEQSQQINRALSDEAYAKKILSSPQAQAIIKKLMK